MGRVKRFCVSSCWLRAGLHIDTADRSFLFSTFSNQSDPKSRGGGNAPLVYRGGRTVSTLSALRDSNEDIV